MSRLVWDQDGQRLYRTGVSNGVFYPKDTDGKYNAGEAWNGLTGVTKTPSGAEPTALWADNMKYLNIKSAEEFGCTIECYTYPDGFKQCNGEAELAPGITVGQQTRKPFGFCYRSIIGNDTEGNDHGYELSLVYGCEASPSEQAYQTVNDSPDAITLSYEVNTTPVTVGDGFKPTSILTVDSTKVDKDKLKALEDILYGTNAGVGEDASSGTEPRLPLPDEVAELFAAG